MENGHDDLGSGTPFLLMNVDRDTPTIVGYADGVILVNRDVDG